jgi:tyrosyl-tRNA synthetase
MNEEMKKNLDLILDEVDEVYNLKILKENLDKKEIMLYWGTTPSRIPHLLYLIPLLKIKKFIDYGINVKILLADIHAYLDSKKSDFEFLEHRTDIHEKIIKMILNYFNTNMDRVSFVQGSSFQLSQNYMMDVYKINAHSTVTEVISAGKGAIKHNKDPLMTSLLYPTLQALDIEYIDADIFYGDVNQINICKFTEKILSKLNYRKRTYFLDEINENFLDIEKISFIDNFEQIDRKINNLTIQNLFELIDYLIFDICQIKKIDIKIKEYTIITLEEFYEKYKKKEIIKKDICDFIIDIIDKINQKIRIEFNEEDVKYKLKLANYTPL